jgi:hypothetical protein
VKILCNVTCFLLSLSIIAKEISGDIPPSDDHTRVGMGMGGTQRFCWMSIIGIQNNHAIGIVKIKKRTRWLFDTDFVILFMAFTIIYSYYLE